MSDHVYVAAVVVGGTCVLAVLVVATFALLLGRGMRAQGVARIGSRSEISVRVEVPSVPPFGALPSSPSRRARERRSTIDAGDRAHAAGDGVEHGIARSRVETDYPRAPG